MNIEKNMHMNHIQLHQELNNYFNKRVTFFSWAQKRITKQRNCFDYVWFGDETTATFHPNDNINRYNFHYYSSDIP